MKIVFLCCFVKGFVFVNCLFEFWFLFVWCCGDKLLEYGDFNNDLLGKFIKLFCVFEFFL